MGRGRLTLSVILLALISACVTTSGGVKFPDNGTLYEPTKAGPGPHPAVVVLPSCFGATGTTQYWARQLADQGYVAMIVDSNTPRGTKNNCIPMSRDSRYVYVDDIVRDAYAALAYLRTLPSVAGDRVGVMGFSYGGMAGLRLASRATVTRAGQTLDNSFKAVVALYPTCAGPMRDENNLFDDLSVPTLLLLAGKDEESPSGPCVSIGEKLKARGAPIQWKLYPTATHAFDNPSFGVFGFKNNAGSRGTFTYYYDSAATSDAERESAAFLAKYLKR